jgi:hypothetical protein
MVQIEFSLRVAQKAMEAINDNRFLEKNVEETSTNSIEFDEEFLQEILDALELSGISEDEFTVEIK